MQAADGPNSLLESLSGSRLCSCQGLCSASGAGRLVGMEELPTEVQRVILQDALLMQLHARQQQSMSRWIQPLFQLWAKVVHYERNWPGTDLRGAILGIWVAWPRI